MPDDTSALLRSRAAAAPPLPMLPEDAVGGGIMVKFQFLVDTAAELPHPNARVNDAVPVDMPLAGAGPFPVKSFGPLEEALARGEQAIGGAIGPQRHPSPAVGQTDFHVAGLEDHFLNARLERRPADAAVERPQITARVLP